MNCTEAKNLMPLYVMDDPDLPIEQREELESHMRSCPGCEQDYHRGTFVINLVREHGTVSDGTVQLLRKSEHGNRGMTVQEGWADLQRRIPELARLNKQQKQRGWIYRIGRSAAVAASMALMVTQGWRYFGASPDAGSRAVPAVATFNPSAELIGSKQRSPLPLGQPIVTRDQKQEVRLGNMHQLVLNVRTSATIRADKYQGKTRYNVELAQGELYVEVVPGHPFTVKTPNANLIITGTKFNVRATADQTELTLVKGSVRFGNRNNKWTDVTAGHASTILADAQPTVPRKVDTAVATTWVRRSVVANIPARIGCGVTEELSSVAGESFCSAPPKLEDLDYKSWTASKRAWFAREFPWIFTIEKHLKECGIDTDYVTLLMVSGDIWQFNYPRPMGQTIPVFTADAVRRIAGYYGVDLAGLRETAETGLLSGHPSVHAAENYRMAIQRWHEDITGLKGAIGDGSMSIPAAKTVDHDVLLFTLRAATYLANTRTAAWLWMQNHPDKAGALVTMWGESGVCFNTNHTSTSLGQWYDRLSQEVSAADYISQYVPEILSSPKTVGCDRYAEILRMETLARKVAALSPPN